MTLSLIHLAVATGLAAGALSADAPSRAMCIDDWSTAVPVVRAEGLATVEAVTGLARQHLKGDVIKVTLCMQGPDYVYRLLLRRPDGRHAAFIVDARQPFSR